MPYIAKINKWPTIEIVRGITMTTRRTISVILLAVLAVLSIGAIAAEPADSAAAQTIDTTTWKCRLCPFSYGYTGEVEFGLGYLSEDSYKFGEYNGLVDQGTYFIGNADVQYRSEEGYFADVIARDVGLDSRLIRAEAGVQGNYKVFAQYNEIPHYISDSGTTPYRGNGNDNLTLPPGWTPGATTGAMTDLDASLHGVNLDTQRKIVEVGATKDVGEHWQTGVTVRQQKQEGQRRTSGTFYFGNAAQIVQPVDYTTDEITAFATYTGTRLQSRLAYYGSLFKNGNDSLTWQNAYTPIVAGATAGELALAPDNDFHQLQGSVAYQFTKATRGTAELAIGRMRQDADYLNPTLNSTLTVPALPRSSLDGLVYTTNAKAQLSSEVTDRLRLNASYRYDDHDNKTPHDTYTGVTTDEFVQSPRKPVTYDFTRNLLKLSGDYRFTYRTRGSLGYDYDIYERPKQEVYKTKEGTTWAKVTAKARDNMDVLINVAHSDRDGSNYKAVPTVTPPENPLLRKYNMADRQRDVAGAHVSITPADTVAFTIGADFAKADYSESEIGLTESRETALSADLSWMVTKKATVHLFATQQIIKSWQAGSQSYSTPDWTARNNDTINVVGTGLKYTIIEKRLDVGADYTVSRSRGETVVDTGIPAPSFPNLRTSLQSIKLYTDYRVAERWSLHAAYWYESYDSSDWAVDGVTPDTIPNLLTLGQTSPSYNESFIVLSARYRF